MPSIKRHVARLLVVLLAGGVLAAAPRQENVSEETFAFFKDNCSSCHTIGGGRLAGPDLAGSTDRREPQWLIDFIRNPKAKVDSGDPYALQLLDEANGVLMPTIPGIDDKLAGKLVNLIRLESAAEESRFAGIQLDDRPFTEVDVQRGRALFLGLQSFENGGPSCVSCHTMAGIGGFGGGRLGPDLTTAYGRLEGRKALGAWLAAPPSAVMQPLFKNRPLASDEILALLAVMRGSAQTGMGQAEDETLSFVLAGIGLAGVLMVILDVVWRNRFRSVRRSLLQSL